MGQNDSIINNGNSKDSNISKNAQYNKFMDFSPDPIVILQDDICKFANPAFSDIFGYSQQDVGKDPNFLSVIKDSDKEAVYNRYSDRLAGKPLPRTFLADLVAKDGKRVPCEISGAVIDYNGKKAILAIIRDITERKIAEENLKRSADIFNNIQVGLYIYRLENADDKEGKTLRMLSANQAAADMTGVSVKDVIGKTLDENFPHLRKRWDSKEGKTIPEIYAEVVRSGKAKTLEDVYYGDNRVIEGAFAVKAFPLPDNCVGVAFDNITDRIKTEEALKKRTQELEKFNRLAVGRELKMIELKKRIKELEDGET
ncbi:MAG: PAS domain S-box protein [Nanoarchaeota archaeon]